MNNKKEMEHDAINTFCKPLEFNRLNRGLITKIKRGITKANHAVRQFNRYKAINEKVNNPENTEICLLLYISFTIKGITSAMYMAATLGFSQQPVTEK